MAMIYQLRWNNWRYDNGQFVDVEMDWWTGDTLAEMLEEAYAFPVPILELPRVEVYSLQWPFVPEDKRATAKAERESDDYDSDRLADDLVYAYYFFGHLFDCKYLVVHRFSGVPEPETNCIFVAKYPDLLQLLSLLAHA